MTVFALRPLDEGDYTALYRIAVEFGSKWYRVGKFATSPAAFREALWADVSIQYLAEVRERDRTIPIALLAIHSVSVTDLVAHLDVLDLGIGEPAVVNSAALEMVEHAFRQLPLRKLYYTFPEFVGNALAGDARVVEEGRLRDDVRADGKYFDRVILAVYRPT